MVGRLHLFSSPSSRHGLTLERMPTCSGPAAVAEDTKRVFGQLERTSRVSLEDLLGKTWLGMCKVRCGLSADSCYL